MLSRALLIARVAFFFFQRFSSEPRGQPGSIVRRKSSSTLSDKVCSFGPVRTLPAVYVSAVIDGGSHPFPFRTRKLSLLSPMVLGLRARESRSLQDSRGPLPTRRGASSFLQTARAASRQGRSGRRSLPPKGGHAHVSAKALSGQSSPPRLVNTSRLSLTPLAVNLVGGFFYACVVMPAKAGTSLPDPSP